MGLRLDAMLVVNGSAKSRERAKELIKSDGVKVNGIIVNKPSFLVDDSDNIEITVKPLRYVSRGGLKLEKAICTFNVDVKDKICIDLGASTGGFTDCLLQNGAKKVFAIDVGHDQLDNSLRLRDDVVNIEGVNVKDFSSSFIGEKVDIVTADLSFISIKNAIPVIKELLKENAFAIVLIKPQFEVGKKNIGKGGIVKDKKVHIKMFYDIIGFIEGVGLTVLDTTCSSIKGGDGNIEYLALLKNCISEFPYLSTCDVEKLVVESFETMK